MSAYKALQATKQRYQDHSGAAVAWCWPRGCTSGEVGCCLLVIICQVRLCRNNVMFDWMVTGCDSVGYRMKVKCLSVKNPLSYLICAGIKDVENRSWQTKYRGTVYIHSSGRYAYPAFTELPGLPLPVYRDWFRVFDEHGDFLGDGDYIGFDEKTNQFHLIDEEKQPESIRNEYRFLADNFINAMDHLDATYLHNAAIIGKADIVEVVTDSKSPWAEEGSYHWLLANAMLFKDPVLGVKGRQSFWQYDMPDDTA